ncbi:MAG: response regulator [Flavobacteriales bacterium]|jgi:DNA-binding NtrC family response regulator|nr:response regulator [Flavobacteriales bacterium]MDP4731837.1 response regulator [Flavobacteriales bacterium]MDP4818377.1 response regulator [Flavobacteriales bacterium]
MKMNHSISPNNTPNTMINVLCLDDDAMVLHTFKSLFGNDHNVFTATDPFDAYNIMKSENIHVVISDLEMPSMSGTHFLQRMAQEFPKAQRILLSGNITAEAMLSAINQARVFRVSTKPFKKEEMNDTLQAAFKNYQEMAEKENSIKRLEKQNAQFEFLLRQQMLS